MTYHARPVTPSPKNIVDDGQCHMGTFNSPFRNINLSELSRPLGYQLPECLNKFRLKEWQAFQLNSPEWFICFAVYDTKSIGTAIIMAYSKLQKRMYRYEHKVPTWRLTVPNSLYDSKCYYRSRKLNIEIHNQLDDGLFSISLSAKGFRGLPGLECSFQAHHRTEPIVIVQPFAKNRPLYSHKALMPSEGVICFDGTRQHCNSEDTSMILDHHKGFYPYVMKYDWVTALGHNAQGELQGFNLTDNQVQSPERYNENCLWLNGKMHPLPPVKIRRPHGISSPWEIRDEFEQLSLSFTPLADVRNRLNLGFVKVDYHGPTGILAGHILDATGKRVSFDNFFGMGEKKYVRM